ncbi:formate dehydrogenase accessory sulfurtransferase FdhD [bacterium]|nr:formate dehydrogenase accessory sulfurtransferase FdhD [bacterium]NCT20432.1 formate dehydrogenase accessory sulfurtransferase FdhD [bacterium]OIO83954.1 MAG: formate dehydrogenase family accessory protein FdhD [Anaerolineae bacterium CG2_30_57_67]
MFSGIYRQNHGFSAQALPTPTENPISLTVNGAPWLTLMCTATHLEALAVGFLFNEGVIASRAELADIRLCEHGDNVDVWLTHAAEKPAAWTKTSGCAGGMTAAETLPAPTPIPVGGAPLPPAQITALIGMLFDNQELYKTTGGIHTSALSDGATILLTAEDIGRHNTLDKLAGRALLEGIAPARKILLTTGRVSSEMIQKAARFGAEIVISRTSPTSLSVELAQQSGITLIGYAHRDRFNVYTHAERVNAQGI